MENFISDGKFSFKLKIPLEPKKKMVIYYEKSEESFQKYPPL